MTHNYDEEQLTLLQLAKQTNSLRGHHHHHHHHHEHVQYKQPTQLTTQLGLYALKKLHAMDPTFLKVRQARLLEPVAPGVITYYLNASMYVMIGGYTGYVWKGLGWRGFAGKAAIPLVGLVAAQKGLMIGVNWMREGLYSGKRKRMVSDYSSKYGKEYLIKVLNPQFKL